MSADYRLEIEIRPDLNLAVWRIVGACPLEAMFDITRRYVKAGVYRPGMNILSIQMGKAPPYETEGLEDLSRQIVEIYEPIQQDVKCASVVMTPLHYGLARVFKVMTQGSVFHFCPFYDIAEAREWLQIPAKAVITPEHHDGGEIFI